MKNFSVVQISSFSDIRGLLVDLKASDRHHIPLCKILFSLERKGFLNTIVVDHAATCGQFNAECEIIGEQPAKVVRLHFFGKAPQVDKHSYAGYCDVRPGGTIADAFITTKTVRNRETDSYAFIPSVVKCHLEFPLPEDPSKTGRATLYGFHYIEKNCRETMCAQAALIGVVRYWQSKDKALFPDIKSTIDINRLAGVSEDEQKSAKPRGLSPEEIGKFLVSQGMLYVCNNYTGVSRGRLKREKLLETIYGFIESGFPVILAIKTDDALHAITIIGHTFDKNSWQAMADVGYFSMTPRFEAYHPNVTWVENLIIQDDNFGPYYFLKTHMLEDLIAAMIVPLPYGPVILPYEATNAAATKTIYSKGFISGVKNIITSQKFLKQNAMWFDEFASHLVRTCGDGLVHCRQTRPIKNKLFKRHTA